MKRLALGFVAPLCCLAATCAAQVPVLQRLQPLGILPGQATTIRLSGSGLTEVREVWTSFPTAKPVEPVLPTKPDAKPDPARASFTVQPAADVVPGIYGIRVATAGGVSNLKLLLIDDLPTTPEVATNLTPETAQQLKLPTAVDGVCTAEQIDHFTFHAVAGQRLSFEVVAKRIASTLDPLLRLIDAQGRVLAESDDDAVVGADARFTYRFEKEGDYRLELRDIRYAGNANHVYRLRIGDFPLIGAPFPAAVVKGTKSTLEATGVMLAKLEPMNVDVPKQSTVAVLPLVVQYAKGQGSGFTAALVSDGPEQLEAEPNDAVKQATPLTVGGAMNGRFAQPRDRDYYRIAGKKGERIRIVGRTRTLGSPTDLYLQLYSGDGKRLIAENDDAGLDEGELTATLDAAGEYLLVVEDLIGRGGPEFVYRLEVAPSKPGFTAAIDLDKFDVPYAGLAAAKITVARNGYDGEIRFRVEGAPGILAEGTVAAGKPDAAVQLIVPPEYATGTVLNLQLLAESTTGDMVVEVGSAAALRKSLGGIPKLPPSLKESILIGVTAPAADNFTLTAKEPTTWNADGTQGELTVAVERKKGFVDPVKLQLYGLPTGYTAAVVTIAKDKAEGKIVVKGPEGVKPPQQALFVIGTATVKKVLTQSSLAGLSLAATDAKPATKPAAKPEPTPKKSDAKPSSPPAKKPAKAKS